MRRVGFNFTKSVRFTGGKPIWYLLGVEVGVWNLLPGVSLLAWRRTGRQIELRHSQIAANRLSSGSEAAAGVLLEVAEQELVDWRARK